MYALVDTATEVTAVAGVNYTSYAGEKYDPKNAIEDGQATVSARNITVDYGTGYFVGNSATDDVCLVLGECLEDFRYLLVNDIKGFNVSADINGIFGWARPDRSMQLNPSITPDSNDTSFMLKAMQDQQFGSDFTTRFRKGYVSWIDVGGASER